MNGGDGDRLHAVGPPDVENIWNKSMLTIPAATQATNVDSNSCDLQTPAQKSAAPLQRDRAAKIAATNRVLAHHRDDEVGRVLGSS